MSEDIDWENYESGPFCIHWSELYECEIKCSSCGHTCAQHNGGDECNECECREFTNE